MEPWLKKKNSGEGKMRGVWKEEKKRGQLSGFTEAQFGEKKKGKKKMGRCGGRGNDDTGR